MKAYLITLILINNNKQIITLLYFKLLSNIK